MCMCIPVGFPFSPNYHDGVWGRGPFLRHKQRRSWQIAPMNFSINPGMRNMNGASQRADPPDSRPHPGQRLVMEVEGIGIIFHRHIDAMQGFFFLFIKSNDRQASFCIPLPSSRVARGHSNKSFYAHTRPLTLLWGPKWQADKGVMDPRRRCRKPPSVGSTLPRWRNLAVDTAFSLRIESLLRSHVCSRACEPDPLNRAEITLELNIIPPRLTHAEMDEDLIETHVWSRTSGLHCCKYRFHDRVRARL